MAVLTPSARPEPQHVSGARQKVGNMEGGEGDEVWGAGGVFRSGGGWGGGECSFHSCPLRRRRRCIALHALRPPPLSLSPNLPPPYLCFPSLRLALPSSFTFFLLPAPLIFLTHSIIYSVCSLHPLTHSTHTPPPLPPPRSSPACRTSGSAGVGAFLLLILVFHPCLRLSFWGRAKDGV
jgi:hypothetical protein